MWGKQTLLPLAERGAFMRILWGFGIFLLGVFVLYYGNLHISYVTARLEYRVSAPMLFRTTFSVLVHGSQVLLLLLAWVQIGRGIGSYFGRGELLVSLIFSSAGIGMSWTVFPLFSPNLRYTFTLNFFLIILLVILFQLLTLEVENWIDESAAMLLWVYSFQSLELLPVFPADTGTMSSLLRETYRSSEEIIVTNMVGTALFLSFMAGALTSTWLLARYSLRLAQVRRLWGDEPHKAKKEDDGIREISMVDMRSLVHDLKNPLAVIKGMAFMFQSEANKNTGDCTPQKAEVLLKAANYMERMIGELLYEDQRHAVEVELFFDNLEKHVRPFPWGEDVSISIDPDVKRLALALNEIRFMRALINILDNAWRANRTSGAREIVILVRRNAEFLEIEVLDDGPGYIGQGISYQKSGWGSTGLGLAFARRVVSAHGGTLLLARRSDKGNGTSVLISLPAKIP